MSNDLQTSREILDAFFEEMSKQEGLHKPTVNALVNLYRQKKFTKTNVANALSDAREDQKKNENRES